MEMRRQDEPWDAQIRRDLQELVDPLCREIVCGRLVSWEARERWIEVRRELVCCVPDQLDLIDGIYGARVNRLIEQFCIPREVDELVNDL